MNIMVSHYAVQKGYGSDLYKYVINLSPEEKCHIKTGGTVIFKAGRRSGGLYHGTFWRTVKYTKYNRYVPRVASREDVESVGQEY